MSNLQINNVLSQIRTLQQQTRIGMPGVRPAKDLAGPGATAGASQTSFANVLKAGLDKVNETQASASRLATAFEKGTPGVDLAQVMLESEKASVSFRATVEVRNRLVSAYQDIMNMQI
jgi:flagellar hook-basal body complex protein FliE